MKIYYRIIFFITILFVFLYLLAGKKIFQDISESKKDYQYLTLFSEITSLVKSNYVEDIIPEKKFPGAYSAMISSLDKLSSYLDIEKTEIYRLFKQGTYYSLGIYGIKLLNYFFITDITKNSPAEKAGLKIGDIIKAVNGKSIYSYSFWEMYLSLLTKKVENIELIIFPQSSNVPEKIKMISKLSRPQTTVKTIKPNVYLIELRRVDNQAIETIKNNIKKSNSIKLIIDLRRYSGGNFESFLKITKLFFNNSKPILLKAKHKQHSYPIGSQEAFQYEAVVIINQSTIMYNELLAQIFKSKGVTFIGEKTAGLVSKLNQIHLKDQSSILLTEGLFYLNNKDLAKINVKPDIKFKFRKDQNLTNKCLEILNQN